MIEFSKKLASWRLYDPDIGHLGPSVVTPAPSTQMVDLIVESNYFLLTSTSTWDNVAFIRTMTNLHAIIYNLKSRLYVIRPFWKKI